MLNVIYCLNDVQFSSTLEPIVLDSRMLINSFKEVIVTWISRNLNVDAHNLVGIGRMVGSRTWLGCIPLLGIFF